MTDDVVYIGGANVNAEQSEEIISIARIQHGEAPVCVSSINYGKSIFFIVFVSLAMKRERSAENIAKHENGLNPKRASDNNANEKRQPKMIRKFQHDEKMKTKR